MTNIYQRKSWWKWYLAMAAILIVAISLWYTKSLADKLAQRESQQAEQFAEALRALGKSNLDSTQTNCDVELHRRIIVENTTIPVILLDEGWNIQEYQNISDNAEVVMDTALVRAALNDMVAAGADTIEMSAPPYFRNYLIYSHSRLLQWLRWYPYVQLLLISAFIVFGYLAFSASRRAQENQVWLGMAKETAHQLGTPISAIMGWVDTLKATNEDRPDNLEMIEELRKDVLRLDLVADRFSKIGALPELSYENLYTALERNREYMQRRAPRKVKFEFPSPDAHKSLNALTNSHLLDWVFENLLRNAIDAIETGEGVISARIYEEGNWACIDISDSGKGIPPNKWNTVFQPGYSTKTRGWGLGLSLSKRIIEQYHGGKIFVLRSEIGKGTTFTIRLQK